MISFVIPGIYRGPRPDQEYDWAELKRLGIETILNLEDDMEAVERERVKAESLGMQFINLPMSEIKRPLSLRLNKAVSIIWDKRLQPIFVHCLHGQDRTGYVIAALRMVVHGWTFERAYQEAKDYGHKWWFAPYLLFWPRSLKELEGKR